MTNQIAHFLAKARKLRPQAEVVAAIGENDAAGRAAYMAGFHAAQALIFQREGKIYKTHDGVQSEFRRLTRHDARLDARLHAFLSWAYNLKALADYEIGPGSEVSPERAAEAINAASRFIAVIELMIG